MTTTATTPSASSADPIGTARARHRWWALGVLGLAQFLVVLDASIVNIALTAIGDSLTLDTAALSWVITAYVLPFGGLLLLGGRLADRFGHRRIFWIGVLGFLAASVLAGLAVSGGMLFAARALQGASAALLAPASLALVTQLFVTAKDRGTALGIWGAIAGIGSAAGVLLGGVLTSAFGWESVFFVNVPIGILVLAALPFLVSRDARRVVSEKVDLLGAVTVTLGLTAIVGALSQTQSLGFGHPLVLGLFAIAALLLTAFVIVERRSAAPLVNFAIFRNRSVSAGNLAVLFVGAAMVALFFALSVFMQQVLGYDAMSAGLAQLPLAGALVITAGVMPSITARIGLRATLMGSLVILSAGLAWLAGAPSDAGFVAALLGPSLVIGASIGGALIAATQLAVHGVDGPDAGLAGGLVNTSQQIGGAIGLAVLSTLAAGRTEALLAEGNGLSEAMTGGFSWVFLGAAALCLVGAACVALVRERATALSAP
jgi:EmrB/QacA subfamily drug resistance transporter